MGIFYAQLFEAAKIHVQIMSEHVFYLTKPKSGPDLFA